VDQEVLVAEVMVTQQVVAEALEALEEMEYKEAQLHVAAVVQELLDKVLMVDLELTTAQIKLLVMVV
jgi:hypothetical protein